MSSYDLKIVNGTVANASESFESDIAIKDGRIITVGRTAGAAERVIDAAGRLLLPGGIEAHCHIEQESSSGIMTSDDYYSGSVAAAFGGNTCFVPFAAQHRGQTVESVLETYHARAAARSVIDYSFHLIVSDPTDDVLQRGLPEAVKQGITSFKLYMTYDRLMVDDGQMLDILAVARKLGALTMVHAENHAIIQWISRKLVDGGHHAPKFHALSHPRAAEAEAIHRAVTLASFVDAPILIVHVSTAAGARTIAEARKRGLKVFGETCPQYLFLDAGQMDLPGMDGARFCCSPPLRDAASREAIWRSLQDGTLQVFSSDHSPYRFDETGKLHAGPSPDFTRIASGLPGIELRLPLLFSEGYMKGRITLNRFVALAAANAAGIHGLDYRKGSIGEGMDADIVIWDPDLVREVRARDLHDTVDFTPYEGMSLTGWPTTVIRGGEIVVEDGLLKAAKGSGHFIPRRPIDCGDLPGSLAPELDPARNFGVDFDL